MIQTKSPANLFFMAGDVGWTQAQADAMAMVDLCGAPRMLSYSYPIRRGRFMTIGRLLVVGAASFAASISACGAGPCSDEILRTQVQVDARLEARAAAGPVARESTEALEHRQPTPGSIAAAESGLGEVSAQTVEAVAAAMARAREADRAGDRSACEQALADVRRTIGR